MSAETKPQEPAHLTHWRSMMKSLYLGSHDFQPGQEIKATIESVSKETIKNSEGNPEEVVLMRFVKGKKPMIVNKTNMKSIAKIISNPYIESWPGKQIVLYVASVQAFGEWVDALRVKAEKTITLEDVTVLFKAKRDKLSEKELADATRIISTNEVASFNKLKKLLDSK